MDVEERRFESRPVRVTPCVGLQSPGLDSPPAGGYPEGEVPTWAHTGSCRRKSEVGSGDGIGGRLLDGGSSGRLVFSPDGRRWSS